MGALDGRIEQAQRFQAAHLVHGAGIDLVVIIEGIGRQHETATMPGSQTKGDKECIHDRFLVIEAHLKVKRPEIEGQGL